MSRAAAWLAPLLLALGLAAAPARAQVWGYVDGQGVAHFAAEKVDERYELLFQDGEGFDTSNGVPARNSRGMPSSGARVIAFFEISPGFKQVRQHLREAAREHGLEFELLQALIAAESGFNPQAVSPKGAVGLMQIMPATAERYGVRGDAATPLARKLADPRTNIRTGARYLRDLLRMFPGRLELALAAYNAGEGAVQRAGNRIPNYPETRNYVRTVLQLYALLKPGTDAAAVVQAGSGRAPRRVRMELPGAAPEALQTADARD